MTLVAKSMCEREDLWFDALLVVWGDVMVGGGTEYKNEKGHRFPFVQSQNTKWEGVREGY